MSWGFLGSIGGWVAETVSSVLGGGSSDNSGSRDHGGSYSSSSETYHTSKTTNYEPDKIRVAELENERVGLVKEAQLELIEFNTKMEAAMLEARCRGFHVMQQAMMGMLKEVNLLAEERLVLLENGSLQQIQQVENLYADLKNDVQSDDFLMVKIPQLLELANQFTEHPASHAMFMKGIDQEVATHFIFKTNQLNKLNERCQSVIASVIVSKERMQQHIDIVIVQRIEHLEKVMSSSSQLTLPTSKEGPLQLDAPKASDAHQVMHRES